MIQFEVESPVQPDAVLEVILRAVGARVLANELLKAPAVSGHFQAER